MRQYLLAFVAANLSLAAPLAAQETDRPATAHELLEQADAVLAAIQQISGLRAMAEIPRDVQTRASLRARIEEMVRAEYTEAELAATDRLLKTLQLLDRDANYVQLMLDLLEDQVAGYYDQDNKTFYILDDMDPAMQEGVMSHELHHALQDQHWGIDNIRGRSDRITDISIARSALIEGDALLVMLAYSLGGDTAVWDVPMLAQIIATMSEGQAPTEGIPRVLWDQLLFPYTGGLSFVVELGRSGGWSEIHATYNTPPLSTEQVLHPDRWAAGDAPTWLSFDVSTAIEGDRYAVDIFGEFTIRSVLAQLLPNIAPAACNRAASGWDGDLLEAWALDGGGDVVVWLSVWDNAEEALGFAAIAERLGGAWLDGATEQRASAGYGAAARYTASNGSAQIETWGDLALVVLVKDRESAEASALVSRVVETVWQTHRRWAYPLELHGSAP